VLVAAWGTQELLKDDYGSVADVVRSRVLAVVVAETSCELEANQDTSLLQARAQVEFQKRCEADPVLAGFAKTQQLRAQLMNGGAVQAPRQ